MRHYVLTTSGDIVVCFHPAVCLSCLFVNYVISFSIFIGRIIPKGKRSYSGTQKTPWRMMIEFWSFCITPTYVMLNPQCDVTGNTRMVI